MILTKCKGCGKEIPWGYSRQDKICCNATCRKRYNRRKERFATARREAYGSLSRLRELSKKHPDLHGEIIGLLKWMEADIKDILLLANDIEALRRRDMLAEIARKRTQ